MLRFDKFAVLHFNGADTGDLRAFVCAIVHLSLKGWIYEGCCWGSWANLAMLFFTVPINIESESGY